MTHGAHTTHRSEERDAVRVRTPLGDIAIVVVCVTLEIELVDEACGSGGEEGGQHHELSAFNVHLDQHKVLMPRVREQPLAEVYRMYLLRLHVAVLPKDARDAHCAFDHMRRRLADAKRCIMVPLA